MDERFDAEELAEAECWELVSRTAVGRLAVCLDGRPHIFPINFVRDADSIVGHDAAVVATFADAIVTRRGLELAAAGLIVASVFAAVVPLATQLVLRRDVVASAGMLAGIETQPAALAYAEDRTGGDGRVTAAYALVFPAAMITKIIVVQFLV